MSLVMLEASIHAMTTALSYKIYDALSREGYVHRDKLYSSISE